MIGFGIASSLVHEVGHQAAALLGLVESLRPVLRVQARRAPAQRQAWLLMERWIAESSPTSGRWPRSGWPRRWGRRGGRRPRVFVFQIGLDDPHPFPWIRVKLSCAIGQALYPDPQWGAIAALWDRLYPVGGQDEDRAQVIAALESAVTPFASLLVRHRPPSLRGQRLQEAVVIPEPPTAQAQRAVRAVAGRAGVYAGRGAHPGVRRVRPRPVHRAGSAPSRRTACSGR